MTKADQARVRGLLTEAIRMLCKSSLSYKSELNVEGLLGITLDNNDVFLVNINENVVIGDHRKTLAARPRTPHKQIKRSLPEAHSIKDTQPLVPHATSIASLPGARSDNDESVPQKRTKLDTETNGDITDANVEADSNSTVIDIKGEEDNTTTEQCSKEGSEQVSSLDFGDMLAKYEPEDGANHGSTMESEDITDTNHEKPEITYEYGSENNDGEATDDEDDIVVVKEELAPAPAPKQHQPQYSESSYNAEAMPASLLAHEDYLTAVDAPLADLSYGLDNSTVLSNFDSQILQNTSPRRSKPSGNSSKSRGKAKTSYSSGSHTSTGASDADPSKQTDEESCLQYDLQTLEGIVTNDIEQDTKVQTEDLPHQCPHGCRGYKNKRSLRRHIDSVHLLKHHVCPVCNMTCSRKDNLDKHFKRVHQKTEQGHE